MALLAAGGWWVARQVNPPGAPGAAVTVVIPIGSSNAKIAAVLATRGVVTNARVFQYYVKLRARGPFKAGVLQRPARARGHERRSSTASRRDRCHRPRSQLVIPEGLWLSEIRARILRTFPLMKPAALDHALATVRSKYEPAGVEQPRGPALPRHLPGAAGATGPTPPSWSARWSPPSTSRPTASASATVAQQLGYTPYQVLTVASMVEEEAKLPGDRRQDRPGHLQPAGQRHDARHRRHRRVRAPAAHGEPDPVAARVRLAVQHPRAHRAAADADRVARQGVTWRPRCTRPRATGLYFVVVDRNGGEFFTDSYSAFQTASDTARADGDLRRVTVPTRPDDRRRRHRRPDPPLAARPRSSTPRSRRPGSTGSTWRSRWRRARRRPRSTACARSAWPGCRSPCRTRRPWPTTCRSATSSRPQAPRLRAVNCVVTRDGVAGRAQHRRRRLRRVARGRCRVRSERPPLRRARRRWRGPRRHPGAGRGGRGRGRRRQPQRRTRPRSRPRLAGPAGRVAGPDADRRRLT